jgi:hypothetical protein
MWYRVVLVHRPSNLVSKAIREVTDSYWNHSYLEGMDGVCCEAVWPKVRVISVIEIKAHYDAFGCVYEYGEWYESEITFEKYLNKPYQLNIFWRQPLYYALAHKFGKTHAITSIFNNRGRNGSWFCHELCADHKGLKSPHLADGRYFSNLNRFGYSIN